MKKQKFYAVKNGRQIGVFTSWDECKKQIDGFSGAVYKSFESEDEAKAYLSADTGLDTTFSEIKGFSISQMAEYSKKSPTTMFAFSDGSCQGADAYSCGVVTFLNGEIQKYSEKGTSRDAATSRNVAGELLGAKLAISKAIESGAKKIVVFYDYTGVELWANGSWQAKKPESKAYVSFISDAKSEIDIQFCKVAGHTGVELNELVDKLAKSALGIE